MIGTLQKCSSNISDGYRKFVWWKSSVCFHNCATRYISCETCYNFVRLLLCKPWATYIIKMLPVCMNHRINTSHVHCCVQHQQSWNLMKLPLGSHLALRVQCTYSRWKEETQGVWIQEAATLTLCVLARLSSGWRSCCEWPGPHSLQPDHRQTKQ